VYSAIKTITALSAYVEPLVLDPLRMVFFAELQNPPEEKYMVSQLRSRVHPFEPCNKVVDRLPLEVDVLRDILFEIVGASIPKRVECWLDDVWGLTLFRAVALGPRSCSFVLVSGQLMLTVRSRRIYRWQEAVVADSVAGVKSHLLSELSPFLFAHAQSLGAVFAGPVTSGRYATKDVANRAVLIGGGAGHLPEKRPDSVDRVGGDEMVSFSIQGILV